MLMADTMAIFLVVLGFLLAFPALWLVCRAMWPGVVERSTARCERRPVLSLVVGAGVTLFAILAIAVTSKVAGGAGQIAAFGLACLFLMLAHSGVAGLATHVGRRLPSPVDAERPWRATLRGGVALELTYLLPILGWFVILPVSLVLGAGAATLSILFRVPKAMPAAPVLEESGVPCEAAR